MEEREGMTPYFESEFPWELREAGKCSEHFEILSEFSENSRETSRKEEASWNQNWSMSVFFLDIHVEAVNHERNVYG